MSIKQLALLSGALLALVTQGGCEDPGVTDPGNNEDLLQAWLPLIGGATWRYVEDGAYSDGTRTDTYVYTRTIGGTEVRDGKTFSQSATSEGGEADLYRVEEGIAYEWPHDMPFGFPIFDLSLAPGESSAVEMIHAASGDTLRLTGPMTYTGNETVTTPAGTFTDCRVYTLDATITSTAQPEVVMEAGFINWFAQGVGVVRNTHTFSADEEEPAGERTAVLHYFNIPGGLSGGHDGTYVITGRVMQFEGPPVVGVVVSLNDGSESAPTDTTDAEGSYRFEGFGSGAYLVSIAQLHPDYWWEWAPLDIMVIDEDVEVPDFIVVRMNDPAGGAAIRGWAKTADDFSIPEARILMTRYTAFWENSPTPSGDWSFYALPAGTYTLKAEADYFTFAPDSLVVVLDGASNIEDLLFTGTGGATATGRVLTPLGIGLAGIEMRLGSPFDPNSPHQLAITGGDGSYAFVNVPAGTQTVQGNDMRYAYDYSTYGLDITVTGSEASIPDIEATPIDLAWNSSVSGRIRTGRGQGPWGDNTAGVTLYSTLFGLELDAVADWTNGAFTISNVFDGPFELRASSSIYPVTPDLRSVTVAGGNVSGQDFTITGFTIIGRAVDPDGSPVAGASVTLTAQGFGDLTMTTGSDGRFTFSDLVQYDYQLWISVTGWSFPLQTFMPLTGDRNTGDVTGTPPPPGG